eukprot:COSAG02_NODE_37_length_48203_cov_57.745708_7_plen_46_part_00
MVRDDAGARLRGCGGVGWWRTAAAMGSTAPTSTVAPNTTEVSALT